VTDAIISLGNGTTENGFLYANASNTSTGTRTATPYIFYTNNAERARIDSSGNLLVGKPSDAFGTAGAAYRANGSIAATASANEVLDLNRLSTDGNIMRFFKDGSTVGSIGTIAGRLLIENGDTGLYFVNDTDTIVASGNGAARDNAINLGDQFTRFKDLYLSGGVYLGGTGSANLLDDYEEGTWTPTIVGGSFTGTGTYSVQEGFYRKVGQLVFVSAYMVWTAHTGTGPFVFVLPFTPNVGGFKYSSMTIGYASNVNWGASNTFPNVHIAPNVAEAYLGYSTNNAAWVQSSLDTAGDIIISGCYSAA
jgi:hypothetical protein